MTLNDPSPLSSEVVFENFLLPKFDIPNFLKLAFDASRCALSNETPLKKFYHADLENADPKDGLVLP